MEGDDDVGPTYLDGALFILEFTFEFTLAPLLMLDSPFPLLLELLVILLPVFVWPV
jgi:hypothetical protein